jgi:hypothetical protein
MMPLRFAVRRCACGCDCESHVLRVYGRLQVNNLREIQALRRLSPHSNIVRLLEVL